jgi:hypothetical protein
LNRYLDEVKVESTQSNVVFRSGMRNPKQYKLLFSPACCGDVIRWTGIFRKLNTPFLPHLCPPGPKSCHQHPPHLSSNKAPIVIGVPLTAMVNVPRKPWRQLLKSPNKHHWLKAADEEFVSLL